MEGRLRRVCTPLLLLFVSSFRQGPGHKQVAAKCINRFTTELRVTALSSLSLKGRYSRLSRRNHPTPLGAPGKHPSMVSYESPARMMTKPPDPGMSAQDSVYGIEMVASTARDWIQLSPPCILQPQATRGSRQMKVY